MANRIEIPESREDLITKTKVALWAAPLWGSTVTGMHRFRQLLIWQERDTDIRYLAVYSTNSAWLVIDGKYVGLGVADNRSLVAFTGDRHYIRCMYFDTIKLESLSDENLKTIITIFSVKQCPGRTGKGHRHGRRRRRRYDTPAA